MFAVTMGVLRPVEHFLHITAAGGIVLMLAAGAALLWANSPWHRAYGALWALPIGFRLGTLAFEHSLHFWVNEGLMTFFFLVVGLELRREIHEGVLRSWKAALLPVAMAAGGMVVPALIFVGLNVGAPNLRGWAVPTATDIAFAVGLITLLGRRVPTTLRVLLLALAVADDLGAILIIAVFYTSELSASGLPFLVLGFLLVIGLQRSGMRNPWFYTVPAASIWLGLHAVGIHPALAGVLLGLVTPVRAWYGTRGFLRVAHHAMNEFKAVADQHEHGNPEDFPLDEHDLLSPLHRIAFACREALTPNQWVLGIFHPWVAYFVMPLFALANAGVHLGGVDLTGPTSSRLVPGIVLGLFLGKPAGVLLTAAALHFSGLARLPERVTFRGLLVLGFMAGVGFTVSMFVAELAFGGVAITLAGAKLAVLIGTTLSGIAGLVAGFLLLEEPHPEHHPHHSPRQAELELSGLHEFPTGRS